MPLSLGVEDRDNWLDMKKFRRPDHIWQCISPESFMRLWLSLRSKAPDSHCARHEKNLPKR